MLRKKSEIRISKEAPRTETNSETNKSQIGKIQNIESEGSLFGILYILVIGDCFEFRSAGPLSCFEFFVLGAFARVALFPIRLREVAAKISNRFG
jgi:hypothetical protein